MKTRSVTVAAFVVGVLLPMGTGAAHAAPTSTPTPTPTSTAPASSSPAASTAVPTAPVPSASTPASASPSTSASSSTSTAPGVGPHIAHIAGLASRGLGDPVAAEKFLPISGGGWAQQFQNGWALIQAPSATAATSGPGGVVKGPFLTYFNANQQVKAVGWPIGDEVHDSFGSYQKFDSLNHTVWGALATTPSGAVVRVKMGMYNNYFLGNLRSTLGAPQGEEFDSWKAGGGGHAQNFVNGWATYQSASVKGWFPHSFTFAQMNFAKKGWPTSAPYSACGAQKVNQLHGYTATGDRWCPTSNYAQPATRPITSGTGQTVVGGMNGVKVWKIQNRLIQLGILTNFRQTTQNSTMGPATVRAVKTFQSRHGLPATGSVDARTWSALVGSSPAFNVDAWKQPSLVSTSATRDARVKAMVNWARGHANKRTPYIWGGTGWWGFDCSGFLLQAMRAGGVDPRNVNNFIDTRSSSDLSWQMYKDNEFQRGSFRSLQDLKEGDFIYYGDSGRVRHVAMYIGGGQVVNEDGTRAAYASASGRVAGWSKSQVWGVNRPFAI